MKPQFINAKIVGVNTRNEDYQREQGQRGKPDFVMSRSQIMAFSECPLAWLEGAEVDETKSTQWGTLIDCLALQPHLFNELYAVAPATYPAKPEKKGEEPVQKPWNRNATFCKEWEESQEGKTILKADEFAVAQRAILRLRADEVISGLLHHSKTQVLITADYVDRFTKLAVPMRALIDLVPDEFS